MPPTPALVTQRGALRLPRPALWLLCAAYLLPGIFGRDPWRNADLVAFAQMQAIAEGRTRWLEPLLGRVAGDAAPLPHGLGALFIAALSPGLDAAVAARLPFVLLLALTLLCTWATTLFLARGAAAQPVPFAFGGEAAPRDYARAIADGALLALIASLGLLQLGHETTPELGQLFGIALLQLALAALPYWRWPPPVSALAMLPALLALAGSGAPTIAVAAGFGGAAVCWRSGDATVRRHAPWIVLAALAAALAAAAFGVFRVRTLPPAGLASTLRQWAWVLWPAWPLALWTLWRWRRLWHSRHLAVPLVGVVVAIAASLSMNGSDRALMLALPGLAVLAAFALPTFKRSTAAAIDWFTMFFFSAAALFLWTYYAAVQTGFPARLQANVAKLLPGYPVRLQPLELALAIAATLAWLWLLRWRTGRERTALWKSLVLPAGGVALCWLLVTTLALPLLDYARSSRPLVDRIAAHVPRGSCIDAPAQSPVTVAALEVFGRYDVDARPDAAGCATVVRVVRSRSAPPPQPGFDRVAAVRRPSERNELTLVERRQAASATGSR